MSLFATQRPLTDRDLRRFAVGLPLAAAVAAWMWGGMGGHVGLWATIGALAGAVGWLWPALLRPLYAGLVFASTLLLQAVVELAILLVFFGMFLPVGLLFRLLGRDALARKVDRDASSYWQPKRPPRGPASYLRPW